MKDRTLAKFKASNAHTPPDRAYKSLRSLAEKSADSEVRLDRGSMVSFGHTSKLAEHSTPCGALLERCKSVGELGETDDVSLMFYYPVIYFQEFMKISKDPDHTIERYLRDGILTHSAGP